MIPTAPLATAALAFAIVTLAASAAGAADTAHRVVGPSLESVAVESVDLETGATVKVLGPAELIPTRVSGHSGREALSRGIPRELEPAPGSCIATLPDGARGRVLHYRQGTRFGFLRIDATGRADVLLERDGLGAQKLIDPFDSTIGVARDGSAVVISAPRNPAAGAADGFLWQVRLKGPSPSPHLLASGPTIRVAGESLTLVEGLLFAVNDAQLLRFDLDPPSPPTSIALPPSGGEVPTTLVPQIAVSREGNRIAVIAGSSDVATDVYLVSTKSGAAVNLTNAPGIVKPPFSTPGDPKAPYLAMSDDGSQIAWQWKVGWEHELFLTDVTGAAPVHTHVTKAPDFETYIDTVSGLLGSGSRMLFVAGSSYAGAFDVYRANLDDEDSPPILNLTKTSGQATPPFTSSHPAKMTVTANHRIGDGLWITDDQSELGTGHHLWWVDELESATEIVAGLSEAPRIGPRCHEGYRLAAVLNAPAYTAVLTLDTSDPEHVALTPVLILPAPFAVERAVAAEASAGLAVVVRAGSQRLTAWLPGGAAPALVPSIGATATFDLGVSPSGRVLTTEQTPAGRVARAFDPATGQVLTHPPHAIALWLP